MRYRHDDAALWTELKRHVRDQAMHPGNIARLIWGFLTSSTSGSM